MKSLMSPISSRETIATQRADDSLDRALDRVMIELREERRMRPVSSRISRLSWVTAVGATSSIGVLAAAIAATQLAAATTIAGVLGFLFGLSVGTLLSAFSRAIAGLAWWPDWGALAKRATDIVGSAIGLALLAPLFLVCSIALRAETRGIPVLTRELQMGKNGRLYELRRFRTSDPRDPSSRSALAAFLQRTDLDKLPELLNVLWGEMSLIGPRPRPPSDYVRGVTHVLAMRPGIVSLADVRRARTLEFAEVLDRLYERKWSLGLDLRILIDAVLQTFGIGWPTESPSTRNHG